MLTSDVIFLLAANKIIEYSANIHGMMLRRKMRMISLFIPDHDERLFGKYTPISGECKCVSIVCINARSKINYLADFRSRYASLLANIMAFTFGAT